LNKAVETFAGDADAETKAIINEDIDSTIASQVSLNQATSAFATQIISVLNARRRFLLTELNIMNESASALDSDGYINSFIYTQDEKATIVNAFETYANLLYSFNSNLNTKVSNVQGMIGSLEKCKPPTTDAATPSPAAPTRLLQSGSPVQPSGSPVQPSGSAVQPSGSAAQPSGSPVQPSGSAAQPSGSPAQPSGSPAQPSGSGPKPSGSEAKPSGSEAKPSGSGPKPSGSGPKPSGSGSNGGRPKGKDGRPKGKIPEEFENVKTQLVSSLTSKGGDYAQLAGYITENMNPESEYKPNGSIFKTLFMRMQGNAKTIIEREFYNVKSNKPAEGGDLIFLCKFGVCNCSGSCPADLSAIKNISLATNNQILNSIVARLLRRFLQTTASASGTAPSGSASGTAPSGFASGSASGSGSGSKPISSDDVVTDYVFAYMVLAGKRYSYVQAKMSLSGGVLDFFAPGLGLGKKGVEDKRKCNEALAQNNDNTKLEECRGKMNDECARGMDGACKAQGLYERLVNRPLPEAALPSQCDKANPNYTVDSCFSWLEPFIIKSSLSFDYKGFLDLPKSIDRSFRGSAALRYLQTTTQVTVDPVTAKDKQAVLPTSLTKMDTNSINVEGSTAVSAANTETLLNEFKEESKEIVLSQNYLSFTVYALLAIVGLLF